jgi:hypothetical protein
VGTKHLVDIAEEAPSTCSGGPLAASQRDPSGFIDIGLA